MKAERTSRGAGLWSDHNPPLDKYARDADARVLDGFFAQGERGNRVSQVGEFFTSGISRNGIQSYTIRNGEVIRPKTPRQQRVQNFFDDTQQGWNTMKFVWNAEASELWKAAKQKAKDAYTGESRRRREEKRASRAQLGPERHLRDMVPHREPTLKYGLFSSLFSREPRHTLEGRQYWDKVNRLYGSDEPDHQSTVASSKKAASEQDKRNEQPADTRKHSHERSSQAKDPRGWKEGVWVVPEEERSSEKSKDSGVVFGPAPHIAKEHAKTSEIPTVVEGEVVQRDDEVLEFGAGAQQDKKTTDVELYQPQERGTSGVVFDDGDNVVSLEEYIDSRFSDQDRYDGDYGTDYHR